MKPAGFHLLIFVVAGILTAQEPAPASTAKVSGRLKEVVRTSLPAYTPPPPKVLDQPKSDGTESDPDLFALPTLKVREKRAPRIDPAELLAKRELDKKLARAYRESLATGLDAFLNSFPIPLFSASPAERGKSLEDQREFADAYRISELRRQVDGENADQLKADLKQTERDIEWRQRPAGDGRKK